MKYKNDYEVGATPDDNNNTRLPGTCNPEPMRGDSAYGPGKNMFGKPGPLDAVDTGGVVGMPTINSGYGMEGGMSPSVNAKVSVSGPTGEVETTYDHANLSAKYKYPNVHQDIPSLGNPSVQYNDQT